MPSAPGLIPLADAARGLVHVFVRDLALEAQIGIHKHEQGTTQPIRINIDLAVTEPTGRLDDKLAQVVCYQAISDRVRAIVADGHVNLVETLAETVAQSCLEDPRVMTARIRIEKLQAIDGAASAGVEIERTRATLPRGA